ncbi:MAG TPA: polysaccharide deacetylase family protein [Verrucomicrobiae bacterium]|nr:polysaccharide deacetylase family protein [Verrucomicrobiae bacterium]
MKLVTLAFLAGALAYGSWRTLVHDTNGVPAVVPPSMNLHLEFSGDVIARSYRALRAKPPGARPKLMALTFDDGPYPIFTPLLLDELHDLHVPATFFLIGRDAEQWPELAARIERYGNEVGDHTYSHPNLDQESAAQVREEVLRGRDVLWQLTHDPAVRVYMRPPHGRYTMATLRAVQSVGYTVVLWTDDGGDWRTITPKELATHVIEHATAPDLVLLHSGKLATIEALPEIVARFRKAGYEFVTVGQLFDRVRAAQLNDPAPSHV